MNVTEFKTRFTVFNDVDDEIVASELLLSESLLTSRIWTVEIQKTIAQGFLTAHRLELERMENLTLGGALRAIEEGRSIDLKLLERNLDYYKQTVYGMSYWNLLKLVIGTSIFVA
jgi:histidyl-tRNA synthetase